jgi:lipopolysaccharide export LptBFGC system permease protein LptF
MRDLDNVARLLERERALSQQFLVDPENAPKNDLHKIRSSIAQRVSEPFACLAVALVGVSMGVQARRKGRTSLFSTGLGVLVLYYAMVTVSEPTSLRELSTFIMRAWIPNLMLMALGVGLLWRVDRA